jgi:ATP-binding cassette subfamily B protein
MNSSSVKPNEPRKGWSAQLRDARRLLSYATRYWQLKAILILIIVTTVLDVLTPAIIGNIIDIIGIISKNTNPQPNISSVLGPILIPLAEWFSYTFGYNASYATLAVFTVSLIAIATLTGLLNYLGRYSTAYLSQKVSFDIRSDLYNSLLEQSFSFYDQQRTGQLMARATGDIGLIERFFDFGLRMIVSTVLLIGLVLYTLFSMDIGLTLMALVTMPFILYSVSRYAMKVTPLWGKLRDQYGDITSIIQENLMGLRVVRGFAREDYEESKMAAESQEYFDTNITSTKLRSLYLPLATLISSVGFALIIWYGGSEVIAGTITLGSFVAFYFYVARLSQPVRMIGMTTSLFIRATAASERVFEIVDAEVSVSDKPDALEFENIEGRVTFEDVSFSYDGTNKVLNKINLMVEPGKTIAILGATGSGKSSIINLIPRFYDVSGGSIKIDDHDVRDIKIKSLRSHIGIVRQDPFIFSTTLRENIAYGVENAKLDDVVQAAKQAKIHEFIASLPESYDTKVGERGVTVSGGQKQRLAIARALLKNPKILILDDSTSSVDTQTEYEIQEALDELLENRTTFIITQRLSSIKKADYIVVLDNGEIVEEGIHDELLARDGIYRKLYETQIGEVVQMEVS